ncbi:MAG TPA: hypothetical protein VEV16_02665, partial [Daejeonella sp.]|nr:hypothetical protein [Daejeonella sp.]
YTSYLLEYKRKNYQRALDYLQRVYTQDSITYNNNISDKIKFTEIQHQQQEKQRENELIIARQKYKETLLWASVVVVILAFGVIFLVARNAKKTTQTNKQLTLLNQEISRQKDDLDRVNQHLEDIIQERTKDLRTKNKKLSEYSSHLSHQIRGPVATLKGLLILENDNLIEHEELIQQMKVCVNDIDDKIMHINETLNNPEIRSLSGRY